MRADLETRLLDLQDKIPPLKYYLNGCSVCGWTDEDAEDLLRIFTPKRMERIQDFIERAKVEDEGWGDTALMHVLFECYDPPRELKETTNMLNGDLRQAAYVMNSIYQLSRVYFYYRPEIHKRVRKLSRLLKEAQKLSREISEFASVSPYSF